MKAGLGYFQAQQQIVQLGERGGKERQSCLLSPGALELSSQPPARCTPAASGASGAQLRLSVCRIYLLTGLLKFLIPAWSFESPPVKMEVSYQ